MPSLLPKLPPDSVILRSFDAFFHDQVIAVATGDSLGTEVWAQIRDILKQILKQLDTSMGREAMTTLPESEK